MLPGPGDQQTRVLPVCRHQGPGGGVAGEDTELSLDQDQKIYIPIRFSICDTEEDKEDLDKILKFINIKDNKIDFFEYIINKFVISEKKLDKRDFDARCFTNLSPASNVNACPNFTGMTSVLFGGTRTTACDCELGA